MAWLEQNSAGMYHLVFRLSGERFRRSLRTGDEREAQARLVRVEENIRLVESGRMTLPEQDDVTSFLLSDGKLNGKPKAAPRLRLVATRICFRTSSTRRSPTSFASPFKRPQVQFASAARCASG